MSTEPELSPELSKVAPKPPQKRVWHVTTLVAFTVAGGLFVTSGLNSGGLDLRAASVTDLDSVVRQERARADDLQQRVAKLNAQVTDLTEKVDDDTVTQLQGQVDELRGPAGFEAVEGIGLTVTLKDAPKSERDRVAAEKGDVEVDDLLVHQQDIQAVANALWAGGAEAMTIQKQRVISTTGIKCVGPTVVLQGLPYAPPYVLSAIGDPAELLAALDASPYIADYLTIVEAYNLGYDEKVEDKLEFSGYTGSSDLQYAEAADVEATRS